MGLATLIVQGIGDTTSTYTKSRDHPSRGLNNYQYCDLPKQLGNKYQDHGPTVLIWLEVLFLENSWESPVHAEVALTFSQV